MGISAGMQKAYLPKGVERIGDAMPEKGDKPKGRAPLYSGLLSTQDRVPAGQLAIWENQYKVKENQPDLTGTLTDSSNVRYRVALWKRR